MCKHIALNASRFCRLGCLLFGSLPDAEHPFSQQSLSAAEAAACTEWASLSAGQLVDRLLAEHVPNAIEVKRRAALQALLDARGEAFSAAQLPGITASKQAAIRIKKGQAIDRLPKVPFAVAVDASLEVDTALAAAHCFQQNDVRRSASKGKVQYVQQFSNIFAAAEWRDLAMFSIYGRCELHANHVCCTPQQVLESMNGDTA